MDQFHLSLGANLLLWGFPLALAVFVVANAARDSFRSGLEK